MEVKHSVVFVGDLPPRGPRRGRPRKYDAKLELLKSRPGQWARISRLGTSGGAWTTIARLKRRKEWNSGSVELVARRHGKNGSDIYARYLTEDPIPFMDDSEVTDENDNT